MQDFKQLVELITTTQHGLQQTALQNVNKLLTIRNWLIGLYIVEYEQKGNDRAKYGTRLIEELSKVLTAKKLKGFSYTNLNLYRKLYSSYPQIIQSVTEQLRQPGMKLLQDSSINLEKLPEIKSDISAYSPEPKLLLKHFTFTHFVELIKVEDQLKRAFYEIEGIKGHWSVRQLKRQIQSLLYERTGLSKNKKSLLSKLASKPQIVSVSETIKDPYILEFTGLKERSEFSENDLETALLDHIQEFLLELGTGFCFEARQKRITIDNEHDKIDLVFYHRLLQCHILIDLKVRAFSHKDVGQMNYYLNYYKNNVMTKADKYPVGLILCTDKNNTKVEYATAGLNSKVFVSQYKIMLPDERELEELIQKDRQEIEGS